MKTRCRLRLTICGWLIAVALLTTSLPVAGQTVSDTIIRNGFIVFCEYTSITYYPMYCDSIGIMEYLDYIQNRSGMINSRKQESVDNIYNKMNEPR